MGKIRGYKVVSKDNKVVSELVGTQPRELLSKFRNQGYKIKKITLSDIKS